MKALSLSIFLFLYVILLVTQLVLSATDENVDDSDWSAQQVLYYEPSPSTTPLRVNTTSDIWSNNYGSYLNYSPSKRSDRSAYGSAYHFGFEKNW